MVPLALLSWLALTVAGLELIDLDSGPELVSLPMDHGLTVFDALGLAALLLGSVTPVVIARRRVPAHRLPVVPPLLSAAAVAGSLACLVTAALLVPDFSGRRFVVAGLVLISQCAGAVAFLTRRRWHDEPV